MQASGISMELTMIYSTGVLTTPQSRMSVERLPASERHGDSLQCIPSLGMGKSGATDNASFSCTSYISRQ